MAGGGETIKVDADSASRRDALLSRGEVSGCLSL